MTYPILLALYVSDVAASARFYTDVLTRDPVYLSDNYAQFQLGTESRLGLWRQGDVTPSPCGAGCRSEIDFLVADRSEVEAVHARWQALNVAIVQGPAMLDFGFSVLAHDPDGHRLRVLAPPG